MENRGFAREVILTLLLLPAAVGCRPAPDASEQGGQPFDARQLGRLDAVIEQAIVDKEAVGAVLLVEHRGRTIYRKAFGYRSLVPQPEPMTVDTIFDMASLTKVLATATSVMILVEEGRLSLTDQVIRYLPEFDGDEEGCRQGTEKSCVTLLQLLTHYSGLRPDIDWKDYWSGYDTAIQTGLAEELQSAPGERFVYSDIGYFLLGEIVRRVSGKPLDEFARQRIFVPLGMKDTGFRPPPELLPRIAPTEGRAHYDPAAAERDPEGRMLRGRVHDPTTDRMGGVAGHAGLFSTVDDTARYARMILNGGRLDGARILSPLSVRAMTTPQSPPGKPARGIGFDIDSPLSTVRGDLFPVGSFGHTGFTGTSLWIDPETQTFVILFTSRLHPDGTGNVVSLRKRVASVAAASLRDVSPWNR